MQRMLNDWYAKMGQLIQEFDSKYEQGEITAPVESEFLILRRLSRDIGKNSLVTGQ
jgi:hypothetical protein